MTLSQLEKVPLVLVLTVITCWCSYAAWVTYQENNISDLKSYKDKYRSEETDKRLDFLVIGAAECGTENLNHLLKQHPQLRNKVGAVHYFDTHYAKGMKYYSSKLPSLKPGQLSFESTPAYFTNPHVPRRVYETNPNVKLVVALCDPLLRMLNHIRKAYLTSKRWPSKTKLNHFETFDFTANFPASLLKIVLHEMDYEGSESNIEATPENVRKMYDYVNSVKGKPNFFIQVIFRIQS